ncbi:MAG: ornithine carbamoyltransferase [Candidatus Diapherotrites archaeon]|nr:ornithine carbamoyltransferase [Candidatus Diapherotrites archaeon]
MQKKLVISPKKDLLSLLDWSSKEVKFVLKSSVDIKANPKKYSKALNGKILTLLFEKQSTRTRSSFEAGMYQLGGQAIYLDWKTTQLQKARLEDEILCLESYSNVIAARVFKQSDLEIMADVTQIPVINALSDLFHPCQALSDFLTIQEYSENLANVTVAYIGDGNNVCNSLIIAAAKLGVQIKVATPKKYEPLEDAVYEGKKEGVLQLFNDPKEAVQNADFVYTDTWISMGEENLKKVKEKAFQNYQINVDLLSHANKNAKIMHCLPAYPGKEINELLIRSNKSIIFQQAANKLHAQKAVLNFVLNR